MEALYSLYNDLMEVLRNTCDNAWRHSLRRNARKLLPLYALRILEVKELSSVRSGFGYHGYPARNCQL